MTKEEAKGIINKIKYEYTFNCNKNSLKVIKALNMAIEALTDRPTGEWIDVNGDGSLWRCDQCKDTACCKGNFCPTCGAIMKGGDSE